MLRAVSSVGKAAYQAASLTGLTAGKEQPPYPCALPLQVIHGPDDHANFRRVADAIFDAALDLFEGPDHDWRPVAFQDPDGADLLLFTKPHIGQYNFAKATMTFRGATPALFLEAVHGGDLARRRAFSSELVAFSILAEPGPGMNVQYHEYRAPPPVSNRHLVYLVEQRQVRGPGRAGTGASAATAGSVTEAAAVTSYIYGCSIHYAPLRKTGTGTVVSLCLWAWALTPDGPDTRATYASCLSPNGWVPTFIVNWMKGAIARELVAIRRFLYQQRPEPGAGRTIAGAAAGNADDDLSAARIDNRADDDDDDEEAFQVRNVPLQEEPFLWRDLEESEELLFF